MSQSEKRPYTKRNLAYWESRHSSSSTPTAAPIQINTAPTSEKIVTVPFPEISYAACGDSAPTPSVRGGQTNTLGTDPAAFQNIKSISLPYYGYNATRQAYVGASDAIDLCARAWAGVSSARNAVEVSVEFSNQPLYIKCKNKTVKKFFQEWFHALRMNKLKENFFREYYRSGNVFLMTFDGKFGPKYFQNFQNSFGSKENKIPIRYELLNPLNIFIPVGLMAPYTYVRLLSTYEIQRLKNPLTEQDKQVYQSLPQYAKDQINDFQSSPLGIYIPLAPDRLRYAFYKKQSYEPLAVPMLWPVLPDIEWKLMLKKQDKALVQNVERILLLVTTGEAPNQWNGGKGINQNNITGLQSLLVNQTLNRILVADYSTKAQFIVPDLSGLNPDKYKIVNEDIREGLQSVLTGDDKFANAQMKAMIFIQRLEEGQNAFLEDFLNVEIQNVCERMNFRDKPEVKFRKINLKDEAMMARIITQLAQLGILTGPQTVNALESGVMPDREEMDEGQTEYTKDRNAGKYFPLVGGSQKQDGGSPIGGGGRPPGTKAPQTTKRVGPIGTGEELEWPKFSLKSIVEAMRDRSNLEESIAKELKKRHKLKELNEAQKDAVGSLTFAIMATKPRAEWSKNFKKAIDNPPLVSEAAMEELDELRTTYRLRDAWEAVVLKNSEIEKTS